MANIPVGGVFENIGEIFIGIEAVFLRGFDNTVKNGARFGAAWRVGEKPVLPTDNKRLDTAFGAVIADFEPAVFKVTLQIFALITHIDDSDGKPGFGWQIG